MSVVNLESVSKRYRKGREDVSVLENIDLQIEKQDFVALMGPSGSGKTTLLNLIGGLDQPTGGNVTINGVALNSMSRKQLARWRAENVGFIFQFYNLLPVLTAQRNVELPLLLTKLNSQRRKKNALTALEIVVLSDRARHRPAELSGGQQQRVAIARAIVGDPELLVCDEPTGDLDRQNTEEVLNLLNVLNEERQKTIIMVTHDPRAADHAKRVFHLDKGVLSEHDASQSDESGSES